MTTMVGLPIRKDVFPQMYLRNCPLEFILLIGGTESGQIVVRDVRENGFQIFIVQVLLFFKTRHTQLQLQMSKWILAVQHL
jgi:hypothetical protein